MLRRQNPTSAVQPMPSDKLSNGSRLKMLMPEREASPWSKKVLTSTVTLATWLRLSSRRKTAREGLDVSMESWRAGGGRRLT